MAEVTSVSMDVLPEGFIAAALSLTSPRDACMLASVSSRFRSAADSDVAWERFLPPDYKQILSRYTIFDHLLSLPSKKEIYFYLCDHPILIDDGTKSFSLERWTGKKCFMLAARNLEFNYNDIPWPCRWISVPESRFSQVAELSDLCWLHFPNKIKTSMLSPNTTYAAFLVFTPGISGPNPQAVRSTVRISGQEVETRKVCMDPDGFKRLRPPTVRRLPRFVRLPRACYFRLDENDEFPKKRADGWTEVLLGEFHVKEGQDCELEISLTCGTTNYWERGLILEGIEIRPKEN